MRTDELIRLHPHVFHTADARAWDSIQARGLLPTRMLLELVGANPPGPRERSVAYDVPHTEIGSQREIVVIRDQKPLKFLDRVLHDDTTADEFLRILDERCFFWASEDRLRRLLNGKNYRETKQVVLTIDTRSLVAAYGDIIELSPYNSGSAHVPNAPKRGRTTFQTIGNYDYDGWRSKRGKSGDALVEVTVPGAIPDLMAHVVQVRTFPGSDF